MNTPKPEFPSAKILVIDDTLQNTVLVEGFLNFGGYTNVRTLNDSKAAFSAIQEFEPDIVLLDLHMPTPDGYEVLAWIRGPEYQGQNLPVLIFTADTTPSAKMRALELGASDFLTKPADAWEILLRVKNFLSSRMMNLELQNWNENLEAQVEARTHDLSVARREALEALARAAEYRDNETAEHTRRVSEMCREIGLYLGMSDEDAEELFLAAMLHDVGKIGVSDTILFKPGKLDDGEWEEMKRHPIYGAEVFEKSVSPLMQVARVIALNHHERWDGTGYPNHLAGEDIPLVARIVAIADVYDALVSERPYKRAWSHADAVREIASQSGKHFDPRVVEAFLAIQSSFDLPQAA